MPAAEPVHRGQAFRPQARILLDRRGQRGADAHSGQAGLDVPDQERELPAQRAHEKGCRGAGRGLSALLRRGRLSGRRLHGERGAGGQERSFRRARAQERPHGHHPEAGHEPGRAF